VAQPGGAATDATCRSAAVGDVFLYCLAEAVEIAFLVILGVGAGRAGDPAVQRLVGVLGRLESFVDSSTSVGEDERDLESHLSDLGYLE